LKGTPDSAEVRSLGKGPLLLAILALMVAFLLQSQAFIRASSTTFDEPYHLIAGFQYLNCGDFGINAEHPPLAKELAALPVVLFARSLQETGACGARVTPPSEGYAQGIKFLYVNNADQLHLWSRSAVSLIGVGLLVLIFAAARELFGNSAGLLALFFAAFEPNLIVHSSLVTTDMAVTFGFFAASYAAYRYTIAPTLLRIAVTGLATGVTLSAKHSGILVIPVVALIIVIDAIGRIRESAPWKPLALRLTRDACVAGVLALVVLWAVYGFRFAALPGIPNSTAAFQNLVNSLPSGNRPPLLASLLKGAVRWRIIPESYGWGFVYVLTDVIGGRPVWILGHLYPTGEWFYFPLTIALKVPLSLLFFAAIAIIIHHLPVKHARKVVAFLGVPPAVWFAIGMTSKMDIGVRHVLPVFPFIILIAAIGAMLLARQRRAGAVAVTLMLGFQAFSVVRAAPNLLAYSNEVWGGSRQTHRVLLDSNTDWGQGLKAVKSWLDGRGLKDCWYVNYGTGSPSDYGIPCQVLPASLSLWSPLTKVPAPIPPRIKGTLLVSASALRFAPGIELQPYHQFWTVAPLDVIGGSVLVFQENLIWRASQP
jgi:hypothetical protein